MYTMNISLCFLCFSDDRRTVDIQDTHLQPFYEKLTELKIHNTHPLCYICHRRVQQCHQLVQLAKQTQGLLRSVQENNCEMVYIESSLVDLSIKKGVHFELLESTPTNDIKGIASSNSAQEQNVDVAKEEYDSDDTQDVNQTFEEDSQNWLTSTDYNKIENYWKSIKNDYKLKSERKNKSKTYIATEDGRNSDKGKAQNIFICDICNFKCSNKTLLIEHIKEHTCHKRFATNIGKNERPNYSSKFLQKTKRSNAVLSCDVCNLKCLTKNELAIHKRMHMGKKLFICDLCGYKSSRPSYLIMHKRIHTGERPFACDVCNFKCKQKGQLKTHKRSHTREKPFSCDMCDYKCSQPGLLIIHKRSHTGEKPFSCDICNYKSSNMQNLVRHRRIHTGEKPFSCDICDFKFTQKTSLIAHTRTHTGEKPFTCDICNYVSSDKRYLLKHKKTHE